MVLPYINMNLPQLYTCSQSWTLLPPPSPYHPSGSSQCTSPKHAVSCIQLGLAIHYLYDNIHVSKPFSQIIPPSPSPRESKRLFYTSVSLLLPHIQGYHYHLSKFYIHALALVITNTLFQQHEKTLYMDITRWSTPKSDWLYSLQPKIEKLYTVSKNKTRSWLWLRPWTPYCQIQT